jgi:hypothetical protein
MNERIRELAEQAGITTNLDTDFFEKDINKWVDYYSEKFAELIVRECIDTLDQMPVYYKNENDREIERNTISDCIRAIEQRFGI